MWACCTLRVVEIKVQLFAEFAVRWVSVCSIVIRIVFNHVLIYSLSRVAYLLRMAYSWRYGQTKLALIAGYTEMLTLLYRQRYQYSTSNRARRRAATLISTYISPLSWSVAKIKIYFECVATRTVCINPTHRMTPTVQFVTIRSDRWAAAAVGVTSLDTQHRVGRPVQNWTTARNERPRRATVQLSQRAARRHTRRVYIALILSARLSPAAFTDYTSRTLL